MWKYWDEAERGEGNLKAKEMYVILRSLRRSSRTL